MSNKAVGDALVLINDIDAALARGTKHYSTTGRLLLTVEDILGALVEDGQVVFEPAVNPETPYRHPISA